MPNYYTEVTEDIIPGHLAYAEDINLIQDNIEAALAQMICDNFGDGYALSPEEGAFVLTPIGPNEQIDQFSHGELTWKSMSTIYVRQKITINKSSVEGIRVYLKNTSGANRIVHGELRTVETEYVDSDLAASYEVTIPANQTSGNYVDFLFNIHHLALDSYYLVLKYSDGISIRFDNAGGYNGSLATSVDGIQYAVEETDLWFEQKYATTQTYDVVDSTAVVHGEKTHNTDTHVTIPSRSSYGDRIDIVLLNKEGEFEVIQGDAVTSGKPTPPIDKVPFGHLEIAYVSVPKDNYSPLLIDQDDSLGKSRMRSHQERLRRLEKKTNWIFDRNSPERIKYNLTGSTYYDGSSSTGIDVITVGGVITGYRLSDSSVADHYWSFKDFGGNPPFPGMYENNNGISEFVNIDHTDHTDGICKLQKSSSLNLLFSTGRAPGSRLAIPRGVYASDPFYWKRKAMVYKNNARLSNYPGNTFFLDTTTRLSRITVDARHYRNAASVKMVLYRRHGPYIATSSSVFNLRNYPSGKYGIVRTAVLNFEFGDLSLPPGQYVWVLVVEPKYVKTPAEHWMDTIDYRGRVGNVIMFQGQYPAQIPARVQVKHQLAETMVYDVIATKDVLAPNGYIKSSMIDTGNGIGSISADINLQLPTNTYYRLLVTNDNGTTWQDMTSKYLTFPQSSGHQFIWKLEFYSNDGSSTPTLSYSSMKQFAIKISLGLVGGTPQTSGTLVTLPFCGDTILQQALPVGSSVDKFSHWEWLRTWCSKNAGDITIDIEATDDVGAGWTNIKTGIELEDLYHGSVDYSNYEGSYEEDEYNYYCDLNEEIILQDERYIDRCEEAWAEIPDDAYLSHTVDTGVGKFQEGLQSTKTTFSNYTGDTGQEEVFMSKSLGGVNLSNFNSIKLWVLTDIADGLEAGDTQFCIGTSAKCATGEYHNLPSFEKDVWKQVTISPQNPQNLTNILSIGLKRPTTGDEWDEESIWVDAVVGHTSSIGTIDECETGFTSAQSTNVVITQSGTKQSGTYSTQMEVKASAGVGLVAYKTISTPLDLSQYQQIRLYFRSVGGAVSSKDFEMVFGSNSSCTNIIGDGYYLPATTADTWQRVSFDLDSPENLSSVRSIGIRMLKDVTKTLLLDKIEGIKTTQHPFYQKCVRFRFNLTRTQGTDISPSVRKVGVIPIIE
ncbi:MAG: hypothetical protein Q8M92_03790 [Candidatus Subteraquimicrobiales bacterium]|nr:hypothetical protein [Candidatus Subteraquimicrobiales bacterium]